MNTYELIEAAKSGNQDAFGQLYANTYNKNYYFVLRILGRDGDTVAVMRDAYARIHTMLAQYVYKDDAAFEAWTAMICANSAVQFMRSNNVPVFLNMPSGPAGPFSESDFFAQPQGGISVAPDIAERCVWSVLSALTNEERICVLMYYLGQIPLRDIALTLQCSEPLVVNCLREGKRKMEAFSVSAEEAKLPNALAGMGAFLAILYQDLSGMAWSVTAGQSYGGIYAAALGAAGVSQAGTAMGSGMSQAGAAMGSGMSQAGTVMGTAGASQAGTAVLAKAGMSLGAKIAIGITAVLVAVGGGIGIGHLVKKSKSPQKTENTETLSTEAPSTQTEIAATTQTDVVSEEPITEEATTEEFVEDTRYKTAYWPILAESKYYMIYMQKNFPYSIENAGDGTEVAPVCLTDITGDETPELIYVREGEGANYMREVHICTMDENGSAKEVYSNPEDIDVAGGVDYFMFKVKDDPTLYRYSVSMDESIREEYWKLEKNASGELEAVMVMLSEEGPEGMVHKDYSQGERDISEQEYGQMEQALLDSICEVVLYDPDIAQTVAPLAEHAVFTNMSFMRAARMLCYEEPNAEHAMPFMQDRTFFFSSGAGGWGTEMTLHPDGSFEGNYHDSNMGETGPGYPGGTVYICNFQGKFTDVQKVDDDTYSMSLAFCNSDRPAGEEWIEDDIKWVSSGPYGVEGGTTFQLYLPGSKVAGLPESYVGWVYGLGERESLPCFGLYNVQMEEGWSE